MTFLWRICSSLLPLPLAAATVTGRFEAASSRPVKNHTGIVVWLEPVGKQAPLPPATTSTIVQKGKRFNPHITVVTVGSTIDLPNRDPIFHNAFSNFAGQPFDTGLYPPGGTQKVRFRREGVVRVFCNIHSSMSAVILVLATPYFTATNEDGSYEIRNVPVGEYTLKVFHERATEATLKSLEKRVAVLGDTSVSAAKVSEAGFAPEPHLNKYGREYGPEPPDKVGYKNAKP
jgi:plastocyanin